MATSTASTDYFAGRSSTRQRPGLQAWRESPQGQARSPRTPTLGRSISHPLGSPSSYRVEQEDIIIYELGPRYFSAGFAGESRPRCILPFTPDGNRRVGDYRQHATGRAGSARSIGLGEDWAAGYELYKTDLRALDLGLVEDKLDRALRTAMIDYLQLDAKPRKAVLVLPSLLPTPLLEVMLRVLFGHFTQPPSISLFTQPVMCCVSAGLRHGLVIDIGWEETVVAAVSEYKEICQRRSIRACKLLIRETANVLQDSLHQDEGAQPATKVSFSEAEDVTQRMAWCKQRQQATEESDSSVKVMLSAGSFQTHIPFNKLADPVERALFALGSKPNDHDDHDLPVHLLAYQTLLALPVDVRALCVSRIILVGSVSNLPGLKRRLLQEVTDLVDTRGWDPVFSYGSAKPTSSRALQERSSNISMSRMQASPSVPLSPSKMPLQEAVPHAERVHDDIKDPISIKVNIASAKDRLEPVRGAIRGVDALGSWAGASLAATLRIKGIHEIEREGFLKHGLRNSAADI